VTSRWCLRSRPRPMVVPTVGARDPDGLTLLEQFRGRAASRHTQRATGLSLVHRDPTTGQDYLRIPMPKQEVLDRVLQSIGALLAQSDRSR